MSTRAPLSQDLRIRVSAKTERELKRLAHRDDISVAAVVRRLIRAGLESEAAAKEV
jgi:cytidylate kinase